MEYWKPVKGHEDSYEVSNVGRVRRLATQKRQTVIVLKSSLDKYGYEKVVLSCCGVKLNRFVHRLMALSFLTRRKDQDQVNHINGIRNDNRLENLEWCTQSENIKHSFANLGRINNGGLPNKSVISICTNTGREEQYESIAEASRMSDMSRKSIRNCINDPSKNVFGLRWELRDA